MVTYTPNIKNTNNLEYRKIIEKLPVNLQSLDLDKFFSSTVDPLFQKNQTENLSGYIGRKTASIYNKETDFYIKEISANRENYQLEPTFLTKTSTNEKDDVFFYQNLLDKLKYNGAFINNHNRLFEEEYYAWMPPINPDMLINFSQYFWVEGGPTQIDISVPTNIVTDMLNKDSYTTPPFISSISSPVLTIGHVFKINGVAITVSGTTVDSVVSNINSASIPGIYAENNANRLELSSYADLLHTITVENVFGTAPDDLGLPSYISGINFTLQSGNKIFLKDDANTEYNNIPYIIEGVGKNIYIIDDSEFARGGYDEFSYDTTPFDTIESGISPSYICMQRGASNNNIWSRTNRWFHRSLILDQDLTRYVYTQASRPIIEFVKDIELMDYGTYARPPVDLISKTDQLYNIVGSVQYAIDGVTLSDGMRILITGENIPELNNKIYQVYGLVGSGIINLVAEKDGRSNADAIIGDTVRIISGNTFIDKEYYWTGTEWKLCQQKTLSTQAPLFNLYDENKISLKDYKNSSFVGSKIFGYKINSDTPDAILGINTEVSSFGSIIFDNYLENDVITYNGNQTYAGYKYYNINNQYLNDWHKVQYKSRQRILDTFILEEKINPITLVPYIETEYELSQVPETEDDVKPTNLIVKLNNNLLTNNIDYTVTNNILRLSISLVLAKNDVLEVKTWSAKNPIVLKGFYELPINLQGNPNNNSIYSLEYNNLFEHFANTIENQENIQGNTYGSNNYNSTPRDLSRGEFIVQHTAPLLKLMLINSSDNFDLTKALRYCEQEYTKFRRKFYNKLEEFYNSDYTDKLPSVWVNDAIKQINVGKTFMMKLPFSNTGMAGENTYIPSTPASLGLGNIYIPEKFTDNTLTIPKTVIRCHDGSIIKAYDDIRDDVVLELENRIYNSIPEKFKTENLNLFNLYSVKPGRFRETSYTKEEWESLVQPSFERWAAANGVNYRINSDYDSSNPFTWNWNNCYDFNGNIVSGSWRSIYFWYFDTDRPHTNPWEMLGFDRKPSWWNTEYGPAPYTSENYKMWDDIENGYVRSGIRKGYHTCFARPNIKNYKPVSDTGALLDPYQAGIIKQYPTSVDAQKDWKFGDMGTFEYAWFRSEYKPFGYVLAQYLAKPAQYIETNWETNNLVRYYADQIESQLVDIETKKRSQNNVASIHTLDNRVYGVQQFISEYLTFLGMDVSTMFAKKVNNATVQLGWRAGGYLQAETIRAIGDATGLLPNENLFFKLHENKYTKTVVYSGVIITFTGTSYQIFGYDPLNPKFGFKPPMVTGKKSKSTIGTSSYTLYQEREEETEYLPYGYEFVSRQDLFDFLIGYQAYLEEIGWVFDEINSITGEALDFRSSAREFIFWSDEKLEVDNFIALSPVAISIKFNNKFGLVGDINQFVNGIYSLSDRSGFPIDIKNVRFVRKDDTFIVEPLSNQGIFGVRLTINEYEHALLLDNETIFNDKLYIPEYNSRVARIKLFAQRSLGWNGRLISPGIVLNGVSDTVPSFEKLAKDTELFYDPESVGLAKETETYARHLIGYQNRPYLDEILINKQVQFDFYRGMIREKGTKKTFDKMTRSSYLSDTTSFDVYEEWAFRIGEYGATTHRVFFEIKYKQKDIKSNPQLITFVNSNGTDNDYDNIITIYNNDERWVKKSNNPHTGSLYSGQFMPLTTTLPRKGYATSGYVQLNETTYTITKNDWQTFFENNTTISDGETVWQFIKENGDWDVLRFADAATIESIEKDVTPGDPVIVHCDAAHNLLPGDKIFISLDTKSEPNYQGYQTVLSTPTSDTFLIDNPANTGFAGPYDVGSEPKIFKMQSIRFTNNTARNAFTPIGGWNTGDKVFVDSGEETNKWSVYSYNGSGWTLVRKQDYKMDIYKIQKATIYNNLTKNVDVELKLFDPIKGCIDGDADREIYYKLEYDPATYTNGETVNSVPEEAWGDEQVGRLWWNLATTRYLDYEQGSDSYKRDNWGKLLPGLEIEIYEWVKSPVLPADWSSYITSDQAKNKDVMPSGEIIEGKGWVEKQEYNNISGKLDTYYYFWVKDPKYAPKKDFRKLSAYEVKLSLSNVPDFPWFAPIGINSCLVSGTQGLITSDDSILQIRYFSFNIEDNLHRQWLLIREGDKRNIPDDIIWNKMVDSLVGEDKLGNTVPDMNLEENSRYGNFIRPRQSWFKDKLTARKNWVIAVNSEFAKSAIVEEILGWDENLRDQDPQPTTGFDYEVETIEERDILTETTVILNGQKILVTSDENYNGKWALYEYNGSAWIIDEVQSYRVEDFWGYADWYKEGYTSSTYPRLTYNTIIERNADISNINIGDITKILNDGSNRWQMSIYEGDGKFSNIALQNGTIAILDNIYTSDDEESKIATTELLSAIRTNLFTAEQQNRTLFSLINYVFVEQNFVDWVFKTSMIYIVGFEEKLKKYPVLKPDQVSNLMDFINEVKPYRTKIRNFVERRTYSDELLDITISEDIKKKIAVKFNRYGIDKDYKGIILDNQDFLSNGNLLGLGYDDIGYDWPLPYDNDLTDYENFYDIIINNNTFTTPPGIGLSDSIFNGNDFIQPRYDGDEEELILSRIGDGISLNVYVIPTGGATGDGYDTEDYDSDFGYDYADGSIAAITGGGPKVKTMQYLGIGTGPYKIGQIPQSKDAVMVYVNGLLLAQNLYTITWGIDPYITLTSGISYTDKLQIISFAIGGSPLARYKIWDNSSATSYDFGNQTVGPANSLLVTVDGNVATVTVPNENGTVFNISSPTPSNSLIYAYKFNNEYACKVRRQDVTYAGSLTIALTYPPQSFIPKHGTTLVYLNGLRLKPPKTTYYDVSLSATSYAIGYSYVSSANVKVFKNYTQLTNPTDYSVSGSNVILTSPTVSGDLIVIYVEESHDYMISGTNLIIQGSVTITNGDELSIITFNEDQSLNMRTQVFDGVGSGIYNLSLSPFGDDYIIASVNGLDAQFGIDFTINYGISPQIVFKSGHVVSDKIVVSTMPTRPMQMPIAFKLFKSIFNDWNSYRISDYYSTVLTQPLLGNSTEIVIKDSTILSQPNITDNIPGVVWINNERIIYWQIDTSTPGQHKLQKILRGTKGTAWTSDTVPVGTVVRDGSDNQLIPGGYFINANGLSLQNDPNSTTGRFLLEYPGSYNYNG